MLPMFMDDTGLSGLQAVPKDLLHGLAVGGPVQKQHSVEPDAARAGPLHDGDLHRRCRTS
jgi:hypothetical protein